MPPMPQPQPPSSSSSRLPLGPSYGQRQQQQQQQQRPHAATSISSALNRTSTNNKRRNNKRRTLLGCVCSPTRLAVLLIVFTVTYVSWSAHYVLLSSERFDGRALGGQKGIGDEDHFWGAGAVRGVRPARRTNGAAGRKGGGASGAQQRPDDRSAANKDNDAAAGGGGGGSGTFATAPYRFDRHQAESYLQKHGPSSLRRTLTAYLEPPLNDTVPQTIDTGNLDSKKANLETGHPPQFIVPLPRRTHGPETLTKVTYGHRVQTCHDLPAFPIDAGLGKHKRPNVNNRSPLLNPLSEAADCPVDADPFLPWVHDVFPSEDGSAVHFVAQNKRRCNSGKRFIDEIVRLMPQVALMQPVAVARVEEGEAQRLAPDLWNPESAGEKVEGEGASTAPRYKLVPHSQADPDGSYTRFLCRFRATTFPSPSTSTPKSIIVGETLSTYPHNYEFANYRKNDYSMVTPKGKDNHMFWLSNLRFDCPVPDNGDLRRIIANGEGVLSDGTATITVDVIPIRTSPRFGRSNGFFTEDLVGPVVDDKDHYGWGNLLDKALVVKDDGGVSNVGGAVAGAGVGSGGNSVKGGFDARRWWGDRHVLPLVEASGRWENIPVCRHPGPLGGGGVDGIGVESIGEKEGADEKAVAVAVAEEAAVARRVEEGASDTNNEKPHALVACLWASASFTTRGDAQSVSDTTTRLIEWIEFHLLVGFDHIYVYDNTGAHTNETSLGPTLFPRFTSNEVTRIDWPSRVCNNNIPAHENTGERSSQYAAESSCRQRYGPYTEWLASFDADEYLIPQGKYDSLKDVVRDAAKGGTNILTFRSTRALPDVNYVEPFHDHKDCGTASDPECVRVKSDALFLEAYNCDFETLPKPSWSERAKKQIYRPDYVFSHYVHYSTITGGLVRPYSESRFQPRSHFQERPPSERITDEVNEAVMLHSKTTVPEYTSKWKERCKADFVPGHGENCRLGFPWPGNVKGAEGAADADGYGYNCFKNERLTEHWIPMLREAMDRRRERYDRAMRGG